MFCAIIARVQEISGAVQARVGWGVVRFVASANVRPCVMANDDEQDAVPEWDVAAFSADPALQQFIYERFHALARGQLRGRLRFAQTTSLVHEAYLRMRPESRPLDRGHYFAVAATVMRQILIDRARAAQAEKRGGGAPALPLSAADGRIDGEDSASLLWVDSAIQKVRAVDPRLGTLVELKVFGGFEVKEIAVALGVSERTVKRYWRQARALLLADLE